MNKKYALGLLDCNNQELAKMLDITPSYLSRFDELNEFYTSIVDGRLAIEEAKQYKQHAATLYAECDKHKDTIKRIVNALDN